MYVYMCVVFSRVNIVVKEDGGTRGVCVVVLVR